MAGASRHVTGQKDASIVGHRLGAAEHVLQRRDVHAVRMTSLLRLLELLRIAEQHEISRRLRCGEHVRQRHLPRLVHEQHVDGVRAHPRAPTARRCRRARQRRRCAASSSASVGCLGNSQLLRVVLVGFGLVAALHNDVEPRGFAPHRIEQIPDHLVTDRRDADSLAGCTS